MRPKIFKEMTHIIASKARDAMVSNTIHKYFSSLEALIAL